MTTAPTRGDLYARVTAQIIAALEAGPEPYVCPWHQLTQPPRNLVSARPYRGLNTLLLWAASQAHGFISPTWATFSQWAARGSPVRKGERATHIVFWKPRADDQPGLSAAGGDDARPSRGGFVARTFAVFNAAQVTGPPAELLERLSDVDRHARAERFFAALPLEVRHGGEQAYYDRAADRIQLPPYDRFLSAARYYATRAHESVHATGAPHRLGRDLSGRFGTEAYAMEELVAELGAAFVCASLGLAAEPRPDHAAYIANWLTVFRADTRAIFTAASAAQRAADWLERAARASPAPSRVLSRLPGQRRAR